MSGPVFTVEIKADGGSWFADCEVHPTYADPAAADARVAALRARGFTARARIIETEQED